MYIKNVIKKTNGISKEFKTKKGESIIFNSDVKSTDIVIDSDSVTTAINADTTKLYNNIIDIRNFVSDTKCQNSNLEVIIDDANEVTVEFVRYGVDIVRINIMVNEYLTFVFMDDTSELIKKCAAIIRDLKGLLK